MKRFISSSLFFFFMLNTFSQISEQAFINPPNQARPSTYWEWMNGNINKDGLTKDLEYMKNANYGAAMIFEAGVGIPPGVISYNSPQWKDAIIHAVKEAERLNIQLSMHNSPGYSGTGGPWISVEYSMKQLVWTDCFISSNGKVETKIKLPQPYTRMGFYKDAYILAYPSHPSETKSFQSLVKKVTIDGKEIDKKIVADNNLETYFRIESKQVLLFELKEPFEAQAATIYRGKREAPLDPHDGPRDYAPSLILETSNDGIHFTSMGHFNAPALRAMDAPGTLSFTPVQARYFRITSNRGTNLAEIDFHATPRLENYAAKINAVNLPVSLKENPQKVAENEIIHPEQVVDVTDKIDAYGCLKWKAPKGRWTLVRIGYTTTGEMVAAAPDSGIGLDCDKFSKKALDQHFDLFLDPLLDKIKPWCGKTLEALVIDSWEAGKQNWTEELPEYFKSKRGYDLTPYMLAITGRIIEGVNNTERFLWDFRRTHTDMFIENYIEHFKERASRYNLKYAGEAYGDGNFESLEMAARQDYPMSEFWTHYIYGNITTTMMASSVGHVWDRQLIACECYTGTPFNSKFTEHPYGMKALGDYIMTAGVNRFVYHATTHQPYTGNQPGNIMTMGPFGTHLDRNSTWANQFSALNLYNSRCAYMLQQGKYVADILYLKDEAISSGINNYNAVYPATPYGYRWDITGVEALQRLSVKNGKIVLPDGMNYKILVVTPIERTSPETLKRLIDLVKQGMTIMLVGDKPTGYLGLNTQKDKEVKALANELWNANSLGKGRIYHNGELEGILQAENIEPDFRFNARHKNAQIHFIHRSVADDDIYFITNHRRRPEQLTVSCRIKNKTPYLWNAESGETNIPIAYEENGNITRFNITLQESGSIFIVFRNGEKKAEKIKGVVPCPTRIHTKNGDKDFNPEEEFHSTFTISLWAKPETYAAEGRGFLLYPGKEINGNAQVGISMGQNGIRVYERSQLNHSIIEYLNPIEGWTHIALVYAKGIPALYLNGKLVVQGKKSTYNCRPAIDVPMAEEQYIGSFEGDQTKEEVYNYALSQQEIINIFSNGLPSPRSEGKLLKVLAGDWVVRFPKWSKAPSKIILPQLKSLHKHSDFNIKHFSGTAIYCKDFILSKKEYAKKESTQIMLDLGRVENIAEVSINGSPSTLIWKAPYTINVTGLLKEGTNTIEIKVTNLYPNRMIGDESLPEENEYDVHGQLYRFPDWYLQGEYNERKRVLFSSWKHYHANDPLLEAGLLGPVRLFGIK